MGMSNHEAYPPSPSFDAWDLERLMDVAGLASYLGFPVSTVHDWRVRGKGPVAYRFGTHLKFAISDLRTCMAEQREQSKPSARTDRR